MALSDLTISILLAVGPLTGVLFALYISYANWLGSPFRKVSYPPGPSLRSSLSINRQSIPSSQPWKAYADWTKTYGNIIYFRSRRKDVIILNAIDDAREMLERRCAFYSDRAKNVMTDLMGWNFNTELMSYGQEWRGHRKLYQQCFRPKASVAYRPIQVQKSRKLLSDLLDSPDEFRAHCMKASSDVILSLLYGNDLSTEINEYFVSLADKATSAHIHGPLSQSNTINAIPILRYLPPWFPGAEFHRLALAVKNTTSELLEIPMDFMGKGLLRGTASPSLLVDLLENCYMQRDFERIKNVATTTYLAGVNTTTSLVLAFFLAMSQFPAAQKKAQQEIDQVVGSRLPNFEDRASLPYVEALFREVLRWRPPMPLNTAHIATEDDIYNGLHIPKGALVVANIWAMTRDVEKYPDPESFTPERFLDEPGKLSSDDCSLVFGFGRRICPGRHLASATAWLTIVSVLATFNISKSEARDEGLRDAEPAVGYAGGHVSLPPSFTCTIVPRNGNVTDLHRHLYQTYLLRVVHTRSESFQNDDAT